MAEEGEKCIVCLGSATVDVTVKSSALKTIRQGGAVFTAVEQGTKHNAEEIVIHNGGSAANIAFILSKMGVKASAISRVGDDVYGDIVINGLRDAGVDVTYVKRTVATRTGTTVNLSTADGEKTLLVQRGALDHLNPQDVPETYVKHCGGVVITSMTSVTAANAALKAARICKENGHYLALAPSISMIRQNGRILLNLLKQCDTLIVNEGEICALMGDKNCRGAMEKAAKAGVKTVVVMRGVKGSAALRNRAFTEHRAYKVKVADTTGAGDAYAAGFILSELGGKTIEECMDVGARISAMQITKPGAQEGIPTPYQLKHFKARLI